MLKAILALNVASVLRRISQGDCPTEPALSVEMLENMVSDFAAMREGVDRGMVANREAVALIDEINLRAESRQFWGIGQTLHAKLCTIRATLARAAALSRKGG